VQWKPGFFPEEGAAKKRAGTVGFRRFRRRFVINKQRVRSRGVRKETPKKRSRQYKVVCCVCGGECMVPVLPPAGRDLTCLKCLEDARAVKA